MLPGESYALNPRQLAGRVLESYAASVKVREPRGSSCLSSVSFTA